MPRKKTEEATHDEQTELFEPAAGEPTDITVETYDPDCMEFMEDAPAAECDRPELPDSEFPNDEPPGFDSVPEEPQPDPEVDALLQELSDAAGEETPTTEETPLLTDEPEPEFPVEEPSPELPAEPPAPVKKPTPAAVPHIRRTPVPRRVPEQPRVLTIEAGDDVQTEDDRQAAAWHEVQNADWTHRILSGRLVGVEQTASGMTVAVVSYKSFRIVIPVKEMLLLPRDRQSGPEYRDLMERARRVLQSRIGSEIDFVIKGHDNESRSAVGSRRDAMLRKRQTFYLDRNEGGKPLIYEGRVVQARVVAVSEKFIRVEVFGVECSIAPQGLSSVWVSDARETYSVGDRVLVRVTGVRGTTVEDLSVSVVMCGSEREGDLSRCAPQARYAGRVTDVRGGVVYVRLYNGVNAIAHSCFDRRAPGKGDDVSFSVTRLDREHGVAVGIITRIIKQNL